MKKEESWSERCYSSCTRNCPSWSEGSSSEKRTREEKRGPVHVLEIDETIPMDNIGMIGMMTAIGTGSRVVMIEIGRGMDLETDTAATVETETVLGTGTTMTDLVIVPEVHLGIVPLLPLLLRLQLPLLRLPHQLPLLLLPTPRRRQRPRT
jgi:hypothetical protein